MRVALLCWCRTGVHYLDGLCAAGADPVLVLTSTRAPAAPALERACGERAIESDEVDDADSDTLARRLERARPDLVVVAGWPRILRRRVRQLPRIGIVNCHPSLLPHYRGRDPLFWAVLNGETRVGVTIHHLTGDVDAGPILLQREVPVLPRSTAAGLADEVDRCGGSLMPKLIEMVSERGLPEGWVPPESGSYYRPVTDQDGEIDFEESAISVDRLVRACAGVIAAHTFSQRMKLVVVEARPVGLGHASAPGTVLEAGPAAVLVATAPAPGGQPDAVAVTRWLFVGRRFDGDAICELLPLVAGTRLGR